MVKVKIYLKRKVAQEWFIDLANEIKDDFSKEGTWIRSPSGIVWTHRQHGGKVRFLRQYKNGADLVDIRHPSNRRFKNAQAIADFVQWVYYNARDYVKRIVIDLP